MKEVGLLCSGLVAILSTTPMYLLQEAKLEYPGAEHSCKIVGKKPGAPLPCVVNHKLWRSQLCEPIPHTPVHSGYSLLVVVVAQEVDGLAVVPSDSTQISVTPESIPATFCQALGKFMVVEKCDRVVKKIHEQPVVLVGDL